MNFLYKEHWWWIFILLALVAGGIFLFWQNQKKEANLAFFNINRNYKFSLAWLKFRNLLFFFGLIFLGIAVLAPAWGLKEKTIEKKGLDILFTLDVSKSMNALDFSDNRQYISRLDAAKYLIKNFVSKRKNDRFGLVLFAGESYPASPLTFDHTVFLNFLNNASSNDIGKQGTNLANAI